MRVVGRVGLIMALALLGDALLYLSLPAFASRLGIPLWTVGILLSANRLVRLATNGGAAWAFGRLGRWPVMLGATILTVITTALYGLTTAFAPLLLARAGWGTCYSILRLGGLLTVLGVSTSRDRGRLVGLFHSISRIGPTIGVAVGGFALERLGYQSTYLALAAISAIGIPLAWGLPRLEGPPSIAPTLSWRDNVFGGWRLVSVKMTALLNGLSFHGVIFPTIVLALAEAGQTQGATELAGILVSLRSASDTFLASPLGHLSDRLGRSRSLITLLILECGAILALATGLTLGVMVAVGAFLGLFVLSTAVGTVADAAAGDLAPGATRAQVMSSYATWLDLGAAIGPAVGLTVVGSLGLRLTYIGAACLVLIAALQLIVISRVRPWSKIIDEHASAD